MCDGVVRHVDSRVGQTLDQPLGIPRQPRTQTERTSASPFVQPVQNTLEPIPSLLDVCVHLRDQPVR